MRYKPLFVFSAQFLRGPPVVTTEPDHAMQMVWFYVRENFASPDDLVMVLQLGRERKEGNPSEDRSELFLFWKDGHEPERHLYRGLTDWWCEVADGTGGQITHYVGDKLTGIV